MTLGSIAALRPVFYMVMGVSLMIFACRMAQRSNGWGMRIMLFGALALGLGYAVLLPMYEAGLIERITITAEDMRTGDWVEKFSGAALGWHAVKLVLMNLGWLAFGLGASIHVGVLRPLNSNRPEFHTESSTSTTHESIA
ncbi:hypothetical protein JIN85_05540 [Luteolibacter pohnpeiensis]|uniref:Uncharacterized protein n=1 Tax=Luteolibacter pohnpeiensis TaxID=454153 RepID=A0A934S6U5_9BACT|nr:hypothetical protein [Luteolibacter pohnpeiensis]MBK1881866.1 hypothetical protein [Luteolibacter pohnpeiensis]